MPYCLMPTLDPVLVLVVVLVATNTPFGHDWRYQLPFLRAAIAFKYEFVLPVCGGGEGAFIAWQTVTALTTAMTLLSSATRACASAHCLVVNLAERRGFCVYIRAINFRMLLPALFSPAKPVRKAA